MTDKGLRQLLSMARKTNNIKAIEHLESKLGISNKMTVDQMKEETHKQLLFNVENDDKNGLASWGTSKTFNNVMCEIYLRNGMINHTHYAYRFYKLIDDKWKRTKIAEI